MTSADLRHRLRRRFRDQLRQQLGDQLRQQLDQHRRQHLLEKRRRPRAVERLCYVTGAALIGAGLFHLGVFFVDGGPWTGPVSWRKTFTFGVSSA